MTLSLSILCLPKKKKKSLSKISLPNLRDTLCFPDPSLILVYEVHTSFSQSVNIHIYLPICFFSSPFPSKHHFLFFSVSFTFRVFRFGISSWLFYMLILFLHVVSPLSCVMIFVSFLLGCWICNRKLRWPFIYFIFNIPDRFYFFLFAARRRDPLLGKFFFFFFGGGLFLALAISQLNYRIWSCILRQTCNNKWESSGSWVLVSELVFFLLFIILLNDLVPILIKFQSSNSDLK